MSPCENFFCSRSSRNLSPIIMAWPSIALEWLQKSTTVNLGTGENNLIFDDSIGIFSRVESQIPKQAMAKGSCGGVGLRSAGPSGVDRILETISCRDPR